MLVQRALDVGPMLLTSLSFGRNPRSRPASTQRTSMRPVVNESKGALGARIGQHERQRTGSANN